MPEAEQLKHEAEKKIAHSEIKLDDNTFRWIGIPFFGLLIPNATGLFGTLTYNDLYYWLGYLYFISLAFLIWQGNRYIRTIGYGT